MNYYSTMISIIFFFESISRKNTRRGSEQRGQPRVRTVLQWKMVIGREGVARLSLGFRSFTLLTRPPS